MEQHNPLDEIGGPGPEWYRELAEDRGTPWPHAHAITREQHAALIIITIERRAGRYDPGWRCPRCGGPARLPDLASTLAYRKCGYAEVPAGDWVHQ